MAATPLTIECRAIAERITNCTPLEGNAVMLRQMVYQDSATVTELRLLIADGAPELADPLILVAASLGSMLEGGGNLQLHPLLRAQAEPLIAAVDYVDAQP